MTEVPEALLKDLEAHMDDPRIMFEIFCDKRDKKGNIKLSNLYKELEIWTLKNTKVETDYWVTDLSHFNNSIEKIIIYLRRQKNSWNCISWIFEKNIKS